MPFNGALVRAVVYNYPEPAFLCLFADKVVHSPVEASFTAYMRKPVIRSVLNATQNGNRPLPGMAIKTLLYYSYRKTSVAQLEFLGANITNSFMLYHVLPPLLENHSLLAANC